MTVSKYLIIQYIIRLLLNKDKIEWNTSKLRAPEHIISVTGQTAPDLYELIIREGAKPDQELNNDGAHALLLVSSHLEDMRLVDYFGQFGSEMNDADFDGSNGFLYACKGGNVGFLNLLLEDGLSVETKSRKGQNAAHFAKYVHSMYQKHQI